MRKGQDDAYAWVIVEKDGYNIITRDWDVGELYLLEGREVYPLYLGEKLEKAHDR